MKQQAVDKAARHQPQREDVSRKRDPRNGVHDLIIEVAGDTAEPASPALLLHAEYDVTSALVHFDDELLQQLGIFLEIAIEQKNSPAPRIGKAGHDRLV